jgi:ankyrin repeat protein
LAALEGNLKMVTYLVDKGAKWNAIDSAKSNALHYAASGIQGKANTAAVKFLMQKGADYKALANDKFSLLYLAIKASNIGLVDYIAQELPDLVSKQTCSVSPLAFARAKHAKAIAEIIQKKLEKEGGPCWQLSKNCNIR